MSFYTAILPAANEYVRKLVPEDVMRKHTYIAEASDGDNRLVTILIDVNGIANSIKIKELTFIGLLHKKYVPLHLFNEIAKIVYKMQ